MTIPPSIAASTSPRTYDVDARTARTRNLEIRDQQNLPMVKVSGQTYPVKTVLWALGGNWNKEAKCFELPAHTAVEAQGVIDSYAASHVTKPKVSKPQAAPIAKVDTVTYTQRDGTKVVHERVTTPAPVITAPATGIPIGTFAKRIANLNVITDQVVTDLLANGYVEAAAEAVKAMAGFNSAHRLLGA